MGFDKTPLIDPLRNYTVSSALAKYLSTPQTVKEDLQKGKSPVTVSIIKWKKIYEAVDHFSRSDILTYKAFLSQSHTFLGYETCALCLDAMRRLLRKQANIASKSEKCAVCAMSSTDRCIDAGSLYKQIENTFKSEVSRETKEEYTEKLLHLLNKMVDRLHVLERRRF